MLKQARVYIHGDVIGVGFRAWTKIQAKVLGVKGWVKNVDENGVYPKRSRRVEALIQAEEDKLTQMIEILKQGPPVSRVDHVKVIIEDVRGKVFNSFKILK